MKFRPSLRMTSLLIVALWIRPGRAAVPADSTNAKAIMTDVETRDQGDRISSRTQLVIEDKANGRRERLLQSRSMKFEGGVKQLVLFEGPADLRNVGLFTIDNDDAGKPDDQWLYLPALHKSSRITSNDRSGSFMGTDLSYADMMRRDPAAYEYKLLDASVQANGEDCWHIESRPLTPRETKETGYSRSELWISKAKRVPIQSKSYFTDGKKIKYTQFKNLKSVDGIWLAHEIVVKTVSGNELLSSTVLTLVQVKLNTPEVSAADFTTQRLEQGL